MLHTLAGAMGFFLMLHAPTLTGENTEETRYPESGPITTFEKECARCHGPQGKFYGEGFAHHEYTELKEIVKEMMVGPAFLKPSEAETEAMTAYHYTLDKGKPFICITGIDTQAKEIHGEVSYGAELFVKKPGHKLRPVTVRQDRTWKAPYPLDGILLARNDSSKTTLDPEKAPWTVIMQEQAP